MATFTKKTHIHSLQHSYLSNLRFLANSAVRKILACTDSKYNLRSLCIMPAGGDGIGRKQRQGQLSSHGARKNKAKRTPHGLITIYVPPTLPIKEATIKKDANMEPDVCVNIDHILRSIWKKVPQKWLMTCFLSHGKKMNHQNPRKITTRAANLTVCFWKPYSKT